MRVKVKGFELGKCYWFAITENNKGIILTKDFYIHFKKTNSVYIAGELKNNKHIARNISKRQFKRLLARRQIVNKEEISLSEMYPPYEEYQDSYEFSWYDDYACENGCCACCGCSCD